MIIITGASRGIGKFLFKRFRKEGEIVYGTYNSTFPDTEKEEYFTKVDISRVSSIKKWINKIEDKITRVILINCAGTNYSSFAHKSDIKKWVKVINVNLIGTFNVIHAFLPYMREENYGRIINFSSVVSQMGVPGTSAYAASKAGLSGLVKSIAAENAEYQITINNMRLGYFNIGMISDVPKKMLEIIKEKIPAGYLGNPYDIFKLVNFIRETEYINGTNIDLNGGII